MATLVDPFQPSPMERLFDAQARLDTFRPPTSLPDAFDLAMQKQASERRKQVESMTAFDKLVTWVINKWNAVFSPVPCLEDTLSDMVIVMLESKPDGWRFTGDQAKFEEMHVIVNFPSWKKINFQMRTMDHKTFYPDIKGSRRKRKELYLKVLEARDVKILTAITAEVRKQVFMITDQSGTQ